MYYVYIVECADNTFYAGIAIDVERRIQEHNSLGKGAKYTRSRRPVELVYQEVCLDRSKASKREYEIKKRMTRADKIKLINSFVSLK
ncbi:MAG: GIY-YIG nuclease family protein [Epsilonproteobacteria bacterium]|nr:MAG: GIY-YIG nuclease family protein [Campylobacterota bacterium]